MNTNLSSECAGGADAHAAHMDLNGECPWCGAWRDADGREHPEAEHTVDSDDQALDQATDLADAMRRAGVIALPDQRAGKARRWVDSGSGPGYDPGQQR